MPAARDLAPPAPVTAVWMLFFGCLGAPSQGGAVACADYAGDEDLLTACALREVVAIEDSARAAAFCAQLPPARVGACRVRWVNAAVGFRPRPSLAVLLTMCGDARDCAFDALDAWPADSYPAAVAACATYAPSFVEDCAGHAAQRLLDGGASDAQITEAAAQPHAALLVQMLPNHLARLGREHCPDVGRFTAACEADLAHLRGAPGP